MIIVQDRIVVAAAEVDRVRELFAGNYQVEAEARGLIFIESMVSPPLKTFAAPVTLWQRWQVADTATWWAMRARSATPTVAAFWRQIDSLCESRERSYMIAGENIDLPVGEDLTPFEVSVRGYRETAQLALKKNLPVELRIELEQALQKAGELPGIELAQLSANMAPEYAAGDYTWDLLYPDRATARAARASALWQQTLVPVLAGACDRWHALAMEPIGAGLRRREMTDGVKRTAYFRMLPEQADKQDRFERDLLEMPTQISQILNWRLSRAHTLDWDNSGCPPWSHVWEQEFESVDGLLGPYMMHPHHWAHIDRWFDPESGVQALDVNLSHAYSTVTTSVLGLESG